MALSKRTRVQAIILEEIKSGRLKSGQKIENERDLSGRLGVSRVTLSKGLSKLVEQGLLVKKVGSGTYVAADPDEKMTLGFVISYKSSNVAAAIINGLHKILPATKCDIIIKDPHGDPGIEREMVREALDKRVDGLIVSTCHDYNSPVGRLFYEEVCGLVPLVMTDCVVNGRVSCVSSNNYEGGRLAAETLLGRAAARDEFWVVKYGLPYSSLLLRAKGFRDAALQGGVSVVREIDLGAESGAGAGALLQALSGGRRPDGVFLTQDTHLALFLKTAQRLSYPPVSFNLCGFDNFSGVGELFNVPCVQQPFEEIGAEIAKCLKALRQSQDKPAMNIQIMPHL